ncbi:oxidation resistance protein 1 [Gonapodya sp. JEL0774]|nr:oxidation resistance protein 1 [Gonapodya sp. JEL0774]
MSPQRPADAYVSSEVVFGLPMRRFNTAPEHRTPREDDGDDDDGSESSSDTDNEIESESESDQNDEGRSDIVELGDSRREPGTPRNMDPPSRTSSATATSKHHTHKHTHKRHSRSRRWLAALLPFSPTKPSGASKKRSPVSTSALNNRSRSVSPSVYQPRLLPRPPGHNVSVPASGVVRLKNGVVVAEEDGERGEAPAGAMRVLAWFGIDVGSAVTAGPVSPFGGNDPVGEANGAGYPEEDLDAETDPASTNSRSVAPNIHGHRAASSVSGSKSLGGTVGVGVGGRRFSVDEDEFALPPVVLEGRGGDVDEWVLTEDVAQQLRTHLPPQLRLLTHWSLAFSLPLHGSSMRTMYNQLENRGSVVLAVKDENGAVFGAFVGVGDGEEVKARVAGKGYYGTGESSSAHLTSAPHLATSGTDLPQPHPATISPRRLSLPNVDPTLNSSAGSNVVEGGTPGRIRFAEGTRTHNAPRHRAASADPSRRRGGSASGRRNSTGAASIGLASLAATSANLVAGRPLVQVHPATSLNEYYIATTYDGIQIGGGEGGVAMYIGDDLESGHSDGRNETYDLGDIALGALHAEEDAPPESRNFTIVGMEWWWFDRDPARDRKVAAALDVIRATRTMADAAAERKTTDYAQVPW